MVGRSFAVACNVNLSDLLELFLMTDVIVL